MKKIGLLAMAGLWLVCMSMAGQKHAETTKYPSYKGLVMAGYQGWFRMPRDGGLMYPDENKVRIDMWPLIPKGRTSLRYLSHTWTQPQRHA